MNNIYIDDFIKFDLENLSEWKLTFCQYSFWKKMMYSIWIATILIFLIIASVWDCVIAEIIFFILAFISLCICGKFFYKDRYNLLKNRYIEECNVEYTTPKNRNGIIDEIQYILFEKYVINNNFDARKIYILLNVLKSRNSLPKYRYSVVLFLIPIICTLLGAFLGAVFNSGEKNEIIVNYFKNISLIMLLVFAIIFIIECCLSQMFDLFNFNNRRLLRIVENYLLNVDSEEIIAMKEESLSKDVSSNLSI